MDSEVSSERLDLPAIDQIGFVVRDLDAAIARYEPMFGPFSRMDGSVRGARYRGRACDVELRLAFGRSGDVEIELIEWVSGDSPHRDFIEHGREGMHHLRFRVEDVAAWTEKAGRVGYRTLWSGHASEVGVTWAYMERAGDPLLIEFISGV